MSEEIWSIPRNLARSSPYTIYSAGFLTSLVTGRPLGAIFSVSAIVLGDGCNFVLKKIFKSIDPSRKSWMRPSPPSDGCGIYPICSTLNTPTWGMPSGHSQIISFSSIFWSLYLWRKSGLSFQSCLIRTTLLTIISCLIMYSRISCGCHNLQQVLVGSGVGSLLGSGFYFILERCTPELFN